MERRWRSDGRDRCGQRATGTGRPASRATEITVVCLAALQDWVVHRRLPPVWYVPANVAGAGACVALARRGGTSPRDLGVARADVGSGARRGLLVAGPVAAGILAASRHPGGRRWFGDVRYAGLSPARAVYEMVVRVPLGTAFAEELLFRGALLGISLRRRSWRSSVVWTAVLFGLWHLVPGLDRTRADRDHVAVALAGEVAATACAGIVLAMLRGRHGSVVAPTLVHAVANAAAVAAARGLAVAPASTSHRAA